MVVFGITGDKAGLDSGDVPVHRGHGSLVFIVSGIAQPLHDEHGPLVAHEVSQQLPLGEHLGTHPVEEGKGFFNHGNALFKAKTILFLRIVGDRDDDVAVDFGGAGDDFDVTVVDGVKGTGADNQLHVSRLPQVG